MLAMELIKAQKVYFKALKKTLKDERKRAKEMLDIDSENEKKEDFDEDKIHHIKEYEPIVKDEIKNKQNNELEKNKSDKKENETHTVKSDNSSFEHICDENGCRLVKKKIDPKANTSDNLISKKKNIISSNSKSRSDL